MRILGISGSLRARSHNRRLLEEAAELLPSGVELVLFDGLKAVPPFDEDDDVEQAAAAVAALRAAVARADALLFATPEYNSSVPGQLKNAVDWASRPRGAAVAPRQARRGRRCERGRFGGVWAQAELRKVLGMAGARVVAGEVAIALRPAAGADGPPPRRRSARAAAELLEAMLAAAIPPAAVAAA